MRVNRGSVNIEIMVDDIESGDEPRNLRGWLLDEPEFRGRVRLREALPRPGVMGPVPDALVLTLAGGGGVVATATVRMLGSVLIAWLKSRTSQVEVTLRRADGAEVTLNATEVRKLSTDGVALMLDELATRLGPSHAGESEGELGEEMPGDARQEQPTG